MEEERSVGHIPGWYPDPVGDHDLRYHNGTRWTGDVSSDGNRFVAPLVAPPPSRTPTSGTLALTCGVLALSTAWIPFVCVVGAVLAIVAIASGLRSRRYPRASGKATAGIAMGAVGLVLAIGGLWLSVVTVQALSRFDDPGPHEVELTDCAEVGTATSATGTITNLDDSSRSYVVEVDFVNDPATSLDRYAEVAVDDVDPGETREFAVDQDLRYSELDCVVSDVTGPYPFGIRVDQ